MLRKYESPDIEVVSYDVEHSIMDAWNDDYTEMSIPDHIVPDPDLGSEDPDL